MIMTKGSRDDAGHPASSAAEISVERLLAADKAAPVVVHAEQIDTRRGLRRRHLYYNAIAFL
jgi:hypothetical protein